MSSKNGFEGTAGANRARVSRRPWSLAARLTAWYAGSAFILVLVATGYLYWALGHNLDREDDELLAETVEVLRTVMQSQAGDEAAVRNEAEREWEGRRQRQSFGHTAYVRFIGGDGNVVVETPDMSRILPRASFPSPTEAAGLGVDRLSSEGKRFRALAVQAPIHPERPPWVIQVAMDRTQDEELLVDFRKDLWVVLGIALVVCTGVGYQIARAGIRPIHDITETTSRIRSANLAERVTAQGLPAELMNLAQTFNQMLERLEQSFARLSRFSADIAHELRTPVNNLRGEVEVALGKSRTPDEYQEVLNSNLEECSRLSSVIDSLLFLARAENPQTEIVRERFDVGAELATVCAFYEAAAADTGIRIEVAVEGPVYADLNRALFQRAVGNLVANAVAHTPRGGSVTLRAAGDDVTTRVCVQDNGSGIPAEHLPHVFDRFYRTDNVRSSTTGNVGLGLAIVRSIVELHGGTLDIDSEVGRGTKVTLTFPLNK